MTRIIHNQRTLTLLRLYNLLTFRISVTSGSFHALVGIPHHLFYIKSRELRLQMVGDIVGIGHMEIVVAIVSHEHQYVLPSTHILVLCIVDGFVNDVLRICNRIDSESPDTDVWNAKVQEVVTERLIIVEKTNKVVAYETLHLIL